MTNSPVHTSAEDRETDDIPPDADLGSVKTDAGAAAEVADATKAAKRAKIEPIARLASIFLMPLIIVGMMITGYLGSMHSPTPHNMPIVISGSSSSAHSLAQTLRSDEGDAVDISVEDSVTNARSLVKDREVAGAVILDGATATILTASGAGASQVTTVTSLVSPALIQDGFTVVSEDVVPLPANDPAGLAAVFMATALVLAGYLPFSVLRSNSPELLKFRRIVPLLAGWAALVAGLVWVVTGPILKIVPSEHYLPVLAIAWLGVFAISSVQLFITRLFGAFGVIFGLLLLMVLGMPASNMSVSIYTLPEFYRVLHEFLPMGAVGESLRSVLYFDGVGLTPHLLVLAIGAVVGLLATMTYDKLRGHRYPEGVPTDVNIPSLVGGRRPKHDFWRYLALLFFPLAMVTMMIFSMLGAMHQPSPHDVPVAVIGSTVEQADQTIASLEENMSDTFDFTSHSNADIDDVTTLVEDRDLVAALVLPSQDSPEFTLIANQAGNQSAYQVVTRIFTQIAVSQGVPISVDDIASLPKSDSTGVVTMYLAMGWIMAGFIVVIVAANAAPATRPLRKMLPIVAVYSVFMSAVIWLIGGPITGSIDGHFLAMWGSGMIAIFSIAMFTMVFERLLGMFAIIPVMGVLMFLGIPSSNAAISMYMTPEWFRTLHDFLPMPAAAETIRSILYFDGVGVDSHLQVLALWGLISLAFVFIVDSLKPVRTVHDFGDLVTAGGPSGAPTPVSNEEDTPTEAVEQKDILSSSSSGIHVDIDSDSFVGARG